jgi:hypothetical protein
VGGYGRDVNCSTIMAYDCLDRENPSNNPVGTVGPTVETEPGLTPKHISETELLEAAASAHCNGKCTLQFLQLFLSGDRGDHRTSGDIGRYATRCRPIYGE